MADVLVTGGTGYIGSVLVRRLCERGEKVRVLLRPWSPRAGLEGLAVEEAVGDLTDPGSLARAMDGVQRVYHLAAAVRLDPFAEEKLRRINIDGTAAVARAAREAGVRRLVHVSSVAAVGRGSIERPADESQPFDAGEFGPYFRTKHAAEGALLAEVERGLDAVIVNPSNVVGPSAVPGGLAPVLRQISRGRMPFYPPGSASFVAVADVAAGCLLAMEKGRRGERYILGAENLTQRAFLSLAADVAGVKAPRWPIPRAPALFAGRIGDLLGRRFPSAFAFMNSAVVGLMFLDICASSEKARRELGWAPTPVRDAVAAELRAASEASGRSG